MWNFRHDTTLSCLVFSVKTIEKITSLENPCSWSRSNIFSTFFISTVHNSWYWWLKNPKKSCLTRTPSFDFAETGCWAPIWPDVTSIFVGWQCRADQSVLPAPGPWTNYRIHCFCMNVFDLRGAWTQEGFCLRNEPQFWGKWPTRGVARKFSDADFRVYEEKHTFLKRLMERRTTKEYSTIWTAHLVIINDMLIWGIRTVLVHMWQAMVLVSFWFPDTNFLCF